MAMSPLLPLMIALGLGGLGWVVVVVLTARRVQRGSGVPPIAWAPWMFFVGLPAIVLTGAAVGLAPQLQSTTLLTFAALIGLGVLLSLSLAPVPYVAWRAARQDLRVATGACRWCGYPGSESADPAPCPECGRAAGTAPPRIGTSPVAVMGWASAMFVCVGIAALFDPRALFGVAVVVVVIGSWVVPVLVAQRRAR